jgi:hypothetical protein
MDVIAPSLHQLLPLLQQVTAPIGGLDRVADLMRRLLANFAKRAMRARLEYREGQ